jgi:hypothetical protein
MPGWRHDEAVELLTWDPSDGTEGDGDDVDDELPASLAFQGVAEDASAPAERPAAGDRFTTERPAAPLTSGGEAPRSDLPTLKASSLRRVLR